MHRHLHGFGILGRMITEYRHGPDGVGEIDLFESLGKSIRVGWFEEGFGRRTIVFHQDTWEFSIHDGTLTLNRIGTDYCDDAAPEEVNRYTIK